MEDKIINFLDKPHYVKYLYYKSIHKLLKTNLDFLGIDISHIMSMDYRFKLTDAISQEKANKVNSIKSCLDYDAQRLIDSLADALYSLKSYRSENRRGSVTCTTFNDKFDIWKNSIELTKQNATAWWNFNHARTYVKIKCSKETSKHKGVVIDQDEKTSYSHRDIHISPLWFSKVFRRGLAGVQYLGRPCFVADAKKVQIDRLSADNIQVHKVDLLSSKGGILTVHRDMWLASFETSPMSIKDKVVMPAETISAVSPELRRAESNVSQRITRGVLNDLLS